MQFNLLIAGTRDPLEEDSLVLNGFNINIVRQADESAPPPVAKSEIDALICNNFFIHNQIEDFPRLKFVNLVSAGWDKYPLLHARALGVESYNASGVYNIPMAEWALGKTFELFKHSKRSWANQISKEWKKQRDLPELFGKTVAIFGVGSIGAAAAPRFRALGMKVIGVSRRGPFSDEHYDEVVGIEKEEATLRAADVVICCLPSEPSTLARFGRRQFSLMKRSAYFLNVSRGGVVDETALEDVLRRDSIGGAALDVFADEPLNRDSIFWSMDNVLITPHQSFESDRNSTRLQNVVLDNLHNFIERLQEVRN